MKYLLLVAAFLLASTSLNAAPPIVTAVSPRGLERGKATEITVTGANLGPDTQLLVPFDAAVKRLPDAKPNPAQARFEVTASAKTPIGFFLIRVYNSEGVSSPTSLAVDPFPTLAEKEDNNTLEKAQPVPVPVVIDGQCAGGDIDFFRFDAKKGQRLVLETEAARLGAGVVPQLRLTDDKGRFLAVDDTQRVQGDARILFDVPADGAYVVEMADSRYRAAAPAHYRLKIAEYDVADEVFPLGVQRGASTTLVLSGGNLSKEFSVPLEPKTDNRLLRLSGPLGWRDGMALPEVKAGPHPHRRYETLSKAADPSLAPPAKIQGRFTKPGEMHRLRLPVTEGQKLRLHVEAQSLGSRLDGVLKLVDPKGTQLALADDTDVPAGAPGQPAFKSADPALDFTVPKGLGELTLELKDAFGRGGVNFGYLLTIEFAQPDFTLFLQNGEENVPRSGFALVAVSVLRRGYDGPIQLEAKGLPSGWKTHGGFIETKGTNGVLLLEPSVGAMPSPPFSLTVSGRALEGPPLLATAEHPFLLSKEAHPAVSMIRLDSIPVALTSSAPLRLYAPPTFELVNGVTKALPVRIVWAVDAKAPLPSVDVTIAAPGGKPPPGGLVTKPAVAAKDKVELILTAPTTMPDGRHDIVLQAKAKVAGKDITVVGPLVQAQVSAPLN
ncbi:MAG: PPC domain-containing protein [Gemmataceae bacterium]